MLIILINAILSVSKLIVSTFILGISIDSNKCNNLKNLWCLSNWFLKFFLWIIAILLGIIIVLCKWLDMSVDLCRPMDSWCGYCVEIFVRIFAKVSLWIGWPVFGFRCSVLGLLVNIFSQKIEQLFCHIKHLLYLCHDFYTISVSDRLIWLIFNNKQ